MKLKAEERRALAKCRAAECFVAGGPELTVELSNAAYGAVRRSVYDTLVQRGLIAWSSERLRGAGLRLTPEGLAALHSLLGDTP